MYTQRNRELLMNLEDNASGTRSVDPWKNDSVPTAKPTSSRVRDKAADEAGEKLAAEMKVFNSVADELKRKRNTSLSADKKRQLVFETATELFGVAPTWTAFYRETIGGGGVARALFTDADEAREYECSGEHSKVLEMLTVLRSRDLPENDPHEPQRMITVRIPKSLHDSICGEANELCVSVNKLCISRLLQKVDPSMIPSSSQKRRGRRPGSAGSKPSDVQEGLGCSYALRLKVCWGRLGGACDRFASAQRGKSGLQRARWSITSTGRKTRESATESKPLSSLSKGETVG
jgi:hypothetical protein